MNAFDEAERRKKRLTEGQQLFIKIMRSILNNEDEAALELVRERIRKYNTGYNNLAVIFHNQGRIEEALEMLLGNSTFLTDNALTLQSQDLEDYAAEQRIDAENLEEGDWARQRKEMRSSQTKALY